MHGRSKCVTSVSDVIVLSDKLAHIPCSVFQSDCSGLCGTSLYTLKSPVKLGSCICRELPSHGFQFIIICTPVWPHSNPRLPSSSRAKLHVETEGSIMLPLRISCLSLRTLTRWICAPQRLFAPYFSSFGRVSRSQSQSHGSLTS